MINIDKNYIKKSINFLDKQSIKIIQQNLEYHDELIFKNYKNNESLKEYKVKDKIERTVIILKGEITLKEEDIIKLIQKQAKKNIFFF